MDLIDKQVECKEKAMKVKSVQRGHTWVQWVLATLAATTVLTYGFQAGWISPMTKILQSELSPTGAPLTDGEMSMIGSALAFTAVLGVSVYSYLADKIGRRWSIVAIAVPQALSWGLKLTATSTAMLVTARVIGGLAAGGCFSVVPMYAKEISNDEIRGAIVSFVILMQNIGLLVMYTMGGYLEYHTILWIVIVIPVLTTVAMIFAPESPAFLIMKEKYEEAARTVALLRGLDIDDKIVQKEVDYMRTSELHFKNMPQVTVLGILKNKIWRRTFIVGALAISIPALNGHFCIMTYAYTILSSLGVTVNADLLSLVVPVVMIFGAIVSMMVVEKTGRKLILSCSYFLTTAAMAGMAVIIIMKGFDVVVPTWVPMVAVAVSALFYAGGVTPISYVILAEIFNFQIRAKATGCLITLAWALSSLQVALFGPVSALFGMYTTFFAFASFNLLGGISILVFVPETKDKTVEEIEENLGR